MIPLVFLTSCERQNTNSKITEEAENIEAAVLITFSVMGASLLLTYFKKWKQQK
ncbi:hypothetical protein VUJ46_05810 [Chryseobacterium sp. MYb264]|uniref:hypothetical protein n=1 Tax=Chryseobacterium sp. MYb264 TaxID=2745153 RepID=UPI002E106E6A|nr:hypothetical protein VUJ46_05810 [Chryseobacterium sp. MYb264]